MQGISPSLVRLITSLYVFPIIYVTLAQEFQVLFTRGASNKATNKFDRISISVTNIKIIADEERSQRQ